MNFNIAVLPGDGIGPEIIAQALEVTKAVCNKFGHTLTYKTGLVGACAIDATGNPYPDETHELCMQSDAILFGAVGDLRFDNNPNAKVRPEQGLLAMRKKLGLYANLRPVTTFEALIDTLQPHFRLRYRHIAASAGELGYEIPAANLARPGLLLYGIAPMASIYDGVLRPTLKLSSRVSLVRELPPGHGVSYGRTHVTAAPTRVATIGIGYADGWNRHLSGTGVRVYINGHFCPMLGRVTMDQIMADVTHVPFVQPGDEVELIGPHIPVTEIAALADTIPWEILTGLGPRLPRVYR